MAFRRRKTEAPATEPSTPVGKLPTIPSTRYPNDPRGKGYATTYQASRGGWFKKG